MENIVKVLLKEMYEMRSEYEARIEELLDELTDRDWVDSYPAVDDDDNPDSVLNQIRSRKLKAVSPLVVDDDDGV